LDLLSKNQRTQIETRIKQIESTIADLEGRSSQLASEMTSKAVAADHSRLRRLSTEHEEAQEKIVELSAEWERLSLMLEGENG
jgi:predicted  nucleic acid-binding Zn-ribbon protein